MTKLYIFCVITNQFNLKKSDFMGSIFDFLWIFFLRIWHKPVPLTHNSIDFCPEYEFIFIFFWSELKATPTVNTHLQTRLAQRRIISDLSHKSTTFHVFRTYLAVILDTERTNLNFSVSKSKRLDVVKERHCSNKLFTFWTCLMLKNEIQKINFSI